MKLMSNSEGRRHFLRAALSCAGASALGAALHAVPRTTIAQSTNEAIAETPLRDDVIQISGAGGNVPYVPPKDVYVSPAAATLTTRVAMLNSVLYAGFGSLILKVHCDQALETAISIVGAGPRMSNAAKSTA